MSAFWNNRDAALSLHNSLKRVHDLEMKSRDYDYSIPEFLREEQNTAAEAVVDAIRYLMHGDEPDEDGAS